MIPPLRLTEQELKTNDYFDNGTKRGVVLRRYYREITLSLTNKQDNRYYQRNLRSRVPLITFSGDVQGMKLNLYNTASKGVTQRPVHLPNLCFQSPLSTLTVSPLIGPFPINPPADLAPRMNPNLAWFLEPNLVVPADQQMTFEFSLENPNDPLLSDGGEYRVGFVVHAWEFAGWREVVTP
jgi:hypothetical protein